MDNSTLEHLCLNLIRADIEDQVITLLKDAGYWDNPPAWRYYGDYENNYNVVGNQMRRPDAALVEKLVNSIDARLMNECLARGIDPTSDAAPQSIREAVAKFFEEHPTSPTAGLVSEWDKTKRGRIARQIALAATGAKPPGNPCFTISDCGEGQTPMQLPETLMSLNKDIKLRIPFVQGKFNMGGTGVLRFCGHHKLQLVVTRRNPKILNGSVTHSSDPNWGLTVVRREDPTGGRRSSVYTYLSPLGISDRPGRGDVLNFKADSMPIFPKGDKPYEVESEWGTLIKLYEYEIQNRSHILRADGLLSRVDLLLPLSALPMRFHECRGYTGHAGSHDTNVLGLNIRLGDDSRDIKRANIEESFPTSCPLTVMGEKMTANIYAFKKGKADTYRKNEGIIFTVNGQTHGHFTTDFFRRKATGCSYLRDSLLVVVDCSDLSGRAREDLFMNSRDRLSGGELTRAIERELETILKENKLLRDLRQRRQQEQRDLRIEESKPLEDVLKSILKKSPTLTRLFLEGTRISTPFKIKEVEQEERPFEGEKHPTYFKFKGKEYGYVLSRNCHINVRARITFETDVVNDYFTREIDTGEFSLYCIDENSKWVHERFNCNMENGIATLNLTLPDSCKVGDVLDFEAIVNDRTLIEPFANRFRITVLEEAGKRKGGKSKKREPAGKKDGADREVPGMIQPPRPTKVYEHPKEGQKGWEDMGPPFDKFTALRIVHSGESDEESDNGKAIYDFYINMDNVYLKNEQKNPKRDHDVLEACFLFGMVLVGIALVHDDLESEKSRKKQEYEGDMDEEGKANIEEKVEDFTKAIAPILLPMIESLGSLELEFEHVDSAAGEFT
ncbi:MAG: hypothetical protein JRJ38_01575 [Deltaproteobacteria bacterium]|nr:hypothetical protein [Deltaproteobacteria bacterium]